MNTVSVREAKTHLSRLIEAVLSGETVVIAKAGEPVVKIVPIDHVISPAPRRLGFLQDAFSIPADFDAMGRTDIARLFDHGD